MLRQSQIKLSALMIPFISALFLASCANTAKRSSQNSAHARAGQGFHRVGALASVTSDQKIMQELTGKNSQEVMSKSKLKAMPLSFQHLYAGKQAAAQKNYIKSIKHYNTVIKKYPRSSEVKQALIAKSQVYKEMGLAEPAQLNMRMAQKKNVVVNKKRIVKNQDAKKTTR